MEADELTTAWNKLWQAVHAKDECPDWETCPTSKLHTAEQRQVAALRGLEAVGRYLGILA